jgi:Stigma-specific protein, Stig1
MSGSRSPHRVPLMVRKASTGLRRLFALLPLVAFVSCARGDRHESTRAVEQIVSAAGLVECVNGGCGAGQACCGGFCVDTKRDPNHCGACGQACSATRGCCNGACETRIVSNAPLAQPGGACSALRYGRYANQGETNTDHVIPDFSHAGYRGGGVGIPYAKVRATVSAGSGDDRIRIQDAIDRVSELTPESNGLRGAVLLKSGTYQIDGALKIRASGVVLRGEGQGADGTVLVATKAEKHTFVSVSGASAATEDDEVPSTRTDIVDPLVPVGSRRVEARSGSYAVGDLISLVRTPNDAWIRAIKMDASGFSNPCAPGEDSSSGCEPPWEAATFEIAHPRTVVAVDGRKLTLDIPVVDSLDPRYGGGELFKRAVNSGHIRLVGVEQLRLESEFAHSTDEDHGWDAIVFSRVNDSWVRKVTTRHFAGAAVRLANSSNFNTVEEVAYLDPVSRLEGERRYAYYVADGTGNLFQRSYAELARHSFVTSFHVAGPNVWLDSLAENPENDCGPHLRWATGLLFDNIKTDDLFVQNRSDWGTAHGWAGAQVMFWNPEADRLVSDAPTGAMNWVVGGVGAKSQSPKTPSEPFGLWESHGSHVTPRSLYLAQLKDRLGATAVEAVTTPQQRSGDLYEALSAWAGEGELFPDPECSTGEASSGSACCLASCGACMDSSHCGSLSGGPTGCCPDVIEASPRPCSLYSPPCVTADPECNTGIRGSNACCAEACGECGGEDCSLRTAGGADDCCIGRIVERGPSCEESTPPCQIPDPNCERGLRSSNFCCELGCGQCTGPGCSGRPGGASGCCGGAITESNRSCNDHAAPCLIDD